MKPVIVQLAITIGSNVKKYCGKDNFNSRTLNTAFEIQRKNKNRDHHPELYFPEKSSLNCQKQFILKDVYLQAAILNYKNSKDAGGELSSNNKVNQQNVGEK